MFGTPIEEMPDATNRKKRIGVIGPDGRTATTIGRREALPLIGFNTTEPANGPDEENGTIPQREIAPMADVDDAINGTEKEAHEVHTASSATGPVGHTHVSDVTDI